jgi:RNA polymerase sigma-70 factor (ECF subfamily)
MTASEHNELPDFGAMDDAGLVAFARQGHRDAFRHVMQRCNQRLFRVARGIVTDDFEAEDVVQESYVHAYADLHAFRGDASLLTWMTRIVLNEARGRLRRRRNTVDVDKLDTSHAADSRVVPFPSKFGSEDPAAGAARAPIRRLLERAIDELPTPFRIVFVMRELEECSVEETAAQLGLRPETVKTRLHRARRLLRTALVDTLSATIGDAFPFLGTRCSRMTENVLRRLMPET